MNRRKKSGDSDSEKPAVNHVIFICTKRINDLCEMYSFDLEHLFMRIDSMGEGKVKEEEILRSF